MATMHGLARLKFKPTFYRVLGIAILALASDALQGCRSIPQARSEDPTRPALLSGWQEHSIAINGKPRWYRIFRPQGLPPQAPLVLLLHGGTQSM